MKTFEPTKVWDFRNAEVGNEKLGKIVAVDSRLEEKVGEELVSEVTLENRPKCSPNKRARRRA